MLRELSLIIIAGLVFPAFPQHSILARMPYPELGMHPDIIAYLPIAYCLCILVSG